MRPGIGAWKPKRSVSIFGGGSVDDGDFPDLVLDETGNIDVDASISRLDLDLGLGERFLLWPVRKKYEARRRALLEMLRQDTIMGADEA